MREGLNKVISSDDTIIAISTPPGNSGLGVIRMSGPDSFRISRRFFQPRFPGSSLKSRVALVGGWGNATGERIDDVVLTMFRKPRSYTGEDVSEISAHGNPVILRAIIATAKSAGARLAAPGEFTLRAVANGKMDLVQAEAVREFIEAQTEQQARIALHQMDGSLSRRIRPIKHKLVDVIAYLEAGIDFAEDDVDVPPNKAVCDRVREFHLELESLKETFGYGRILTGGLRVPVVGKPNVGKSSLFNRLVCKDRAIVTDIPGTTRDILNETVSLDGVPLCFADTAGIHGATDVVESIGVARAVEAVGEADLALVVLDGSSQLDDDDSRILERIRPIPHLIVVNKSDLPPAFDFNVLNGAPTVSVSAKLGDGIEELTERLRTYLASRRTSIEDDFLLTNIRQYEAVVNATEALGAVEHALEAQIPHEMILLDLYRTLGALNELTGEVVTEDILDRIFSTFCIGK